MCSDVRGRAGCPVCRYLGAGSDRASLYLTVRGVEGDDIVCEAQNGAVMDGLLTVSVR